VLTVDDAGGSANEDDELDGRWAANEWLAGAP